jgi:hypothetical protein
VQQFGDGITKECIAGNLKFNNREKIMPKVKFKSRLLADGHLYLNPGC